MKPNEHATTETAPAHPKGNRLGRETSPYLLQHARNPVDWYPWSAEAFRKAREENKPIFLSVGYSACHWCHVMAHESFENVETAEILNRNFVAVKVDREERPDIDAVYMRAVQAMTGRGGWPMSVFLTPEGAPFYGGTYFPDRPIYGMPAFKEVLAQVAEAWRTRREELSGVGEKVAAALRESAVPVAGDAGPRDGDTAFPAVMRMADAFDDRYGGFGGAPKFPQTMALEFLLRRHLATGDPHALSMATRTLDAMARGGIYDQVGGGFHRYATDEAWRIPHFEKMLYDNALLARVYLHAWQVTGAPRYRGIATGTLDYVIREMSGPSGGFCSAQDADSEGEEGRFYLWTPDGIRAAFAAFAKPKIGPEDTALFFDAYGVTSAGNFEGANILFVDRLADALAARHGLAPEDIESRLLRMRRALFDARKRRVPPARDGKLLAGWNGLMLAAFAEAGRDLARPDYLAAAEACAAFLTGHMQKAPGRLFRSFGGGMATSDGVLEDHANVADGLLALYHATFDPRWFLSARAIGDVILARFADEHGGFYDTSDDHERLIVRPREIQDGALPSGGSMATLVLLRLAAYTGEARYREAAESALSQVRPLMAEFPLGFAHWLNALEFANAPTAEVAIVGEDPGKLLEAVFGKYRPDMVVACGTGREASPVPLLESRTVPGGQTAAYVCRRLACAGPIRDPADLARVLDEPAPAT